MRLIRVVFPEHGGRKTLVIRESNGSRYRPQYVLHFMYWPLAAAWVGVTALGRVGAFYVLAFGRRLGMRHGLGPRGYLQTKGFVVPSLQEERKSRKQECVRRPSQKAIAKETKTHVKQ